MDTIQTILLVLQVLVAVSLIGLILIQHGKGADAGAAFGSGSSGTVFGAQGSGNFLTKATAVLAAVFLANSLALAYMSHQRVDSGVTSIMESAPVTAPVEEETSPIVDDRPVQQSSEIPAIPE